jgi:large subunit ribosomal protein L24
MKFKKGDTIIVTIGKDAGKKGKIEKVLPKENKIIVAGINVYKRHMKRRDDKNPGGIIDRTLPITLGKVALLCPFCNKPTRVGFVVTQKDKVRVCKKCGKKI